MQTFILRIWVPAVLEDESSTEPSSGLRGVLDHIGSGRSIPFRNAAELVGLVCEVLAEPQGPSPSGP